MFLNFFYIILKIRRSKVTDYAALKNSGISRGTKVSIAFRGKMLFRMLHRSC